MQTQVETYTARFAHVLVIETLLELLFQHYTTVATTSTYQPLLDRFYAVDDDGAYSALPSNAEIVIENLWLGRIESYSFPFHGDEVSLQLHPSMVWDDRPLPILVKRDGVVVKVLRRSDERTHSFMCKLHPTLPGMIIDNSRASEWLNDASFHGAPSAVEMIVGHALLERVTALWLKRPARDPPPSTLIADVDQVRGLLRAMVANSDARCHIVCTGQSTIQVFVCLTAGDGSQKDLFRLPVGNVTA
ncbi:MAG: hypothetical protein VYE42_02325 [Actinomycetota bacterium]|nr:hypothetical protein [Actinomycetota bacterium]